MGDRAAAERACKDPNPIIDGRKANVNLAILGAKPRGNLQTSKFTFIRFLLSLLFYIIFRTVTSVTKIFYKIVGLIGVKIWCKRVTSIY